MREGSGFNGFLRGLPINKDRVSVPSDEEASEELSTFPTGASSKPSEPSLLTAAASLTRKQNRSKLYVYFLLLLLLGALLLALAVQNIDSLKAQIKIPFTSYRPLPPVHTLYSNPPPTGRFRDNLIVGFKYVTAWPIEGFTNQFMAQVNLLYLAYLAGRVPVLPSFLPAGRHMGSEDIPSIAVSEIFDLKKLTDEFRRPILEWQDIKNVSLREVEDIGCWSVFKTIFNREPHFGSERELSLDVSLTKVPDSAKFSPERYHVNLMSLASLGWPTARADAIRVAKTSASPVHNHTLPPDESLMCFDNLYYVGSASDFEWEQEWSPSWNLVGRYISFTPRIEELTRAFVLRAFGLASTEVIPPYISVHVRHTDFEARCNNTPWRYCFAPLTLFAERVKEIQGILENDYGLTVDKVLVTSDEANQTWWDGVRELGWKTLDHRKERTVEFFGTWYPIILDSAALSLAKGFVGTSGSTMSLVASKRVQLWAGGPVRTVPIGPL